jgi:hypothetical protein
LCFLLRLQEHCRSRLHSCSIAGPEPAIFAAHFFAKSVWL